MQHRFVNAFDWSSQTTGELRGWEEIDGGVQEERLSGFDATTNTTYNGRQALSMSKDGVGKIEKQGQKRLLLSDKKALSSHPSLPISNTQYSVKLDLFDIFRIELAFNLYNSTPSTESFGVKQMCLTLSQKV